MESLTNLVSIPGRDGTGIQGSGPLPSSGPELDRVGAEKESKEPTWPQIQLFVGPLSGHVDFCLGVFLYDESETRVCCPQTKK